MEENGDIEEFRGKQRGRPKGKRGRGKTGGKSKNIKQQIESDGEDDCKIVTEKEDISPKFDENCDISSLEAPTFTTLNRGPPAPMLKLSWNHPVTLIGEKVVSPRIHTCDTCDKPILIYGRMIPCKHVFCLTCAKSEDRVCSRCGECVARVEQTGLGTVFMCSYTINEALCKRTYLSQRDLQAHIDHRHVKSTSNAPKEEHKENILSYRDPRAEGRANDQRHPPHVRNLSNDPRISGHKEGFEANPQIMRNINPGLPSPQGHAPSSQPNLSHHIPVMTSSRSNLISIPIEDQVEPPFSAQSAQNYPAFHHVQNQQPGLRSSLPHSLHPPPQRAFASPPPVAHSQHMQFPVTSSFNYSNSQQPNPHNSYPPTNAIPQNSHVPSHYASSHNPVPVPPPTTFGNQFSGSQQWPAPPPRLARPMAPSSLGQHPTTHPQNITYYR